MALLCLPIGIGGGSCSYHRIRPGCLRLSTPVYLELPQQTYHRSPTTSSWISLPSALLESSSTSALQESCNCCSGSWRCATADLARLLSGRSTTGRRINEPATTDAVQASTPPSSATLDALIAWHGSYGVSDRHAVRASSKAFWCKAQSAAERCVDSR